MPTEPTFVGALGRASGHSHHGLGQGVAFHNPSARGRFEINLGLGEQGRRAGDAQLDDGGEESALPAATLGCLSRAMKRVGTLVKKVGLVFSMVANTSSMSRGSGIRERGCGP